MPKKQGGARPGRLPAVISSQVARIFEAVYHFRDRPAVLAQGTPSEIVDNAELRRVYLGEHFRM